MKTRRQLKQRIKELEENGINENKLTLSDYDYLLRLTIRDRSEINKITNTSRFHDVTKIIVKIKNIFSETLNKTKQIKL